MRHPCSAVATLAGLLAMPLAAQATFVVDWANGPGAHFTDITVAAAVVPNGSILLVRPGGYTDVVIDGKSLTVLCDAGVFAGSPGSIQPCLLVKNVAASQRVVVRGIAPAPFLMYLEVRSCAGLVMLDGAGAVARMLRIRSSTQVLIRDMVFDGPALFSEASVSLRAGSSAVFELCTMTGQDGSGLSSTYYFPPLPALDVGAASDACTVQLSHCLVEGGDGFQLGPPVAFFGAPAVVLGGGSSLRALGEGMYTIRSGNTPGSGPTTPAVFGTGTARIDAPIQVLPAPFSTPSLPIARPVMPSLVTGGGNLGGTITVVRRGASGIAFAIAISNPGVPAVWPGLDPLWLHPGSTFVETFGVAPVGPFQLQKAVPNLPALQALTVFFQAVDFELGGALPLSNPSAVVLH